MPRYFVLSLEYPFRQADGFFVRKDGEVCFWPSSRTGYVVPENRAKVVGRAYLRYYITVLIMLGVFLIGWPAMGIAIKHFAIPTGFIFLPIIAAVGLGVVAVWLRRRFVVLLKGCPRIREKRPPAIDDKLYVRRLKKVTAVIHSIVILSGSIGCLWMGLFHFENWLIRGAALFLVGVGLWRVATIRKIRREPFTTEDHIPPGGEWTDRTGKVWRSRYPRTDGT